MEMRSTPTMGSMESTGVIPWWLVLMEGVAALVIGLLLLFVPGMTVLILTQILGFYWLVSGVLDIVSIFVDRAMWGWKLFIGILGILAGLAVIRHPYWSAILIPTLIVIFIGVQAIINGAVKIYESFKGGGFGALILGILNIIIGLILLFNPFIGAYALPIVLGIFAIIGGIAAIFGAFRMRSQGIAVPTTGQPPTAQPV